MNAFDINVKELEEILDKIDTLGCKNNANLSMYRDEGKLFVAVEHINQGVKGSFIFLIGDE